MKPVYLTFDIGTTALKTSLVDDDGLMLAVHAHEYSFESPQPGWAEVDPEVYWRAASEGVRAVLARTSVDPTSIAAIGFSSQGESFVPVGRDGTPLHNAVIWVDLRAVDIAREWESTLISSEEYRRISGYPWLPAELSIFKIAWLMRNVQEKSGTWKFLCLPDYMIYRLTGETVTDTITATMMGCFNLNARAWEHRLIDAAGIEESSLPTVLSPGTVAGSLLPSAASELGIPAGIPVCAGANDQIAGAIGAGNCRTGVVSETTGTSLAAVASTTSILDSPRVCVGHHAAENLFYAMQFTNTSAIVLKWFRDMCSPGACYDEFLGGVGMIPPGCDGLTVLPHFSGVPDNPETRGAFIGLTLSHTREHISRAIMESCCCMLRDCVGTLSDLGIGSDVIRSLGGAAQSDLWLQMKADMLVMTVEQPACSEAASLGAAMLAAAGVGRFRSVAEASKEWYRPSRAFEPDECLYDRYDEVYNRYQTLSKLLG